MKGRVMGKNKRKDKAPVTPDTIREIMLTLRDPKWYDAMVHAIAECRSADEAWDIRHKALVMAAVGSVAKDTAIEKLATEIVERANRRAAELLKRTVAKQAPSDPYRPHIERVITQVIEMIKVTDLPYQQFLDKPELRPAIRAFVLSNVASAIHESKGLLLFLGRAQGIKAIDVNTAATIDWEGKIVKAVRLIRQAAAELTDPLRRNTDTSLAEALEQRNAPISEWIESGLSRYALQRIANMIEAEAHLKDEDHHLYKGGNVLPVSARAPFYKHVGIKPKNIGNMGNTKTLLMRELNDRLPASPTGKRFSIIAGLMKLLGHKVGSMQAVRSAVMRGDTRKKRS